MFGRFSLSRIIGRTTELESSGLHDIGKITSLYPAVNTHDATGTVNP